MERTQRDVIVGVFADREQAQKAVNELKQAGFTESQLGMATRNGESGDADMSGSFAEEGAVTGLAAGAGVGALWGLGIAAGFLPGIGPAIAGGTLGVLLSSAAAGAAVAGLTGALIGLGIPEDEAEFYEGEFKAGRTIVTVHHPAAQHQLVTSILKRFGAYDINSRDSHTTGLAGTTAAGMSDMTSTTPPETHRTIEMPVRKEDVVVESQRQPAGPTTGTTGTDIRMPVQEDDVRIGDHGDVLIQKDKPMGHA